MDGMTNAQRALWTFLFYTLIGPSHQLVLGVLAGVYVAGTFLLLISEASRTWAVGMDELRRQG